MVLYYYYSVVTPKKIFLKVCAIKSEAGFDV
jgi:hypothetical protein